MIQSIKAYLYNRDESSTYFMLAMCILALGFLDIKYIVSMALILFIFLNLNNIDGTINDGIYDKKYYFYDDKIDAIMNELRYYRKYNIQSYNLGVKFMKKFIKLISLMNQDESHSRQLFENADYYLKTSINYFMTMTISVKEKSYQEQLNHPTELRSTQIGRLCKQLNRECYYIMWNLAKKINAKNEGVGGDNLDRYKTLFHYSSDAKSFDAYLSDNELF